MSLNCIMIIPCQVKWVSFIPSEWDLISHVSETHFNLCITRCVICFGYLWLTWGRVLSVTDILSSILDSPTWLLTWLHHTSDSRIHMIVINHLCFCAHWDYCFVVCCKHPYMQCNTLQAVYTLTCNDLISAEDKDIAFLTKVPGDGFGSHLELCSPAQEYSVWVLLPISFEVGMLLKMTLC